jgi:MATE family multidrug resistance protein
LGLRGAALASILTNTVMLGIVVAYVRKVLPEHALFVRLWRADWEMFGNVLRLGVPIGLTTLAEVSLFSFSAIMMGWLGTITLAAHGIAIQLASATFMIHLGLSNAATVRAGFAKGRQDPVFLRRAAGAAIVLSLAAAFVTIFFFIGLPELLIAAFLEPADPAKADILLIGTQLLIVAAIFQLMDGAQVIALGLLRGVQDTGVPMILAAIAYFGVGVPASYALGFTFGLGGPGVWLGLVLGLLLAAVLLMGRFWRQSIARVRTVGAT